MVKIFFLDCHDQCYLSAFLYSNSSQPSFVCPSVSGSALVLFWYCYGDISYHTPKMDSCNLNIFSELARSEKTTSCFLRDVWQTDCKPRTASTSFVWLLFSANKITFTYHPLFGLFFHRSYLKTTADILMQSFSLFITHIIAIIWRFI